MTIEEKVAQLGSVWVYQLLTEMQYDATCHELDGVPCAVSKELLTDILRDECGFSPVWQLPNYLRDSTWAAAHHDK